jgi:hypothetical protein
MRKQNTKNNTRGPRRQTSSGRAVVGRSLQPPPFIPTMRLSHKFRFNNGANSGTFTILRSNILNLVLYSTSATLTARIFQAVRLKRVEVWGNPVALGSPPSQVSLEWIGENSPSTVVSDTGMGVRPAHVRSEPPPSSSNRWWSISGTSESDQLFTLILQANSVIDVTLELRLVEQEAPTAGDVPAGASLGQLYGDYLDGLTSGKLVPEGYTALP